MYVYVEPNREFILRDLENSLIDVCKIKVRRNKG